MIRIAAALGAACLLAGPAARADIALSANDGHTVLENGAQVAARPPLPDTLSVIDLSRSPPRIAATIETQGSEAGPPFAVMLAPDESWAIVASATKTDPAAPGGIGTNDRVSVIDMKATPPRIAQSLAAGAGATSPRLSPDGRLLLVANHAEGTVSVFTVKDRRLAAAGKVDLGNPESGPSGLGFTKDGKHALVSREGDNRVSVLDIDDGRVSLAARPLTTGIRPYTLDINVAGTLAAVANLGRGDGDIDSVSLIDLTKTPFRVVEMIGVPSGPEGLKFSPDGRFLAIAAQDGTIRPAASPFHRDHGLLVLYAVQGDTGHGIEPSSRRLRRVAEAPIGRWSQGIAFSRDGRTILVQEMVERQIRVFRWQDSRLTEGAALPINGGPAAIRTSWP
jgi:hypothetical protein